jgi:hypothetical protein
MAGRAQVCFVQPMMRRGPARPGAKTVTGAGSQRDELFNGTLWLGPTILNLGQIAMIVPVEAIGRMQNEPNQRNDRFLRLQSSCRHTEASLSGEIHRLYAL